MPFFAVMRRLRSAQARRNSVTDASEAMRRRNDAARLKFR
jgi:hypothetical protein